MVVMKATSDLLNIHPFLCMHKGCFYFHYSR